MFKSLSEEWDGLSGMIFDKNTSPRQRLEMQKAFYAGCFVVLHNVREMAEPSAPAEDSVRWLSASIDECVTFSEKIMQDYLQGK